MTASESYVLDVVAGTAERRRALQALLKEVCNRLAPRLGRSVKVWREDASVLLDGIGILENICTVDVLVADISNSHPTVMLEVGVRLGLGKPFILLSDANAVPPFELTAFYQFVYTQAGGERVLVAQLTERIEEILKDPQEWQVPWRAGDDPRQKAFNVFVSYSHRDRSYLDRLRVHLKPLERAGRIDLWVDTRIQAGDRWKEAIAAALNRARVAVLLVSADFLASDFIATDELPALLRTAEEQGTLVIPVAVKPSRFLRETNLSVFQAINDPQQPLSSLSESEQEEVFERLSARIEAVIGA